MRERVRNVLVGACMIGALAAAGTLLFLFGELGSLVERDWRVQVRLPSAPGLRQGSLVTMHGVPVGRISSVRFLDAPRKRTVDAKNAVIDRVSVEVAVKDTCTIPANFEARIRESLLGGGATLDLVPPEDAIDGMQPADVWSYAKPPGKDRALHGRAHGLEERMMASIKPMFDDLRGVSDEFRMLAQNLNALLDGGKPGQPPAPDNLRATITKLSEAIDNFNLFSKNANEVIADKQLLSNLRSITANMDSALQSITMTLNGFPGLVESESAKWRTEVTPTLASLNSASAEFERLAAELRAGKGTIGRLIQDPVMHESVVELIQRLEELIEDGARMLEAVRTKGVDVKLW